MIELLTTAEMAEADRLTIAAGVAGIVAGLAARPVLSNLIAGVQLAMTQPIRLEDAVIVENEWGNIEEITSTYVVVRLWDWRRMIVPLTYFIEKPFQNWTRSSAQLPGRSVPCSRMMWNCSGDSSFRHSASECVTG